MKLSRLLFPFTLIIGIIATTDAQTISDNLQACVCAAGDSDLSADGSCLSDYVGLQPASYFKLCVKYLDSEAKVTSLKDISFKAKASGAPDAPDVVEVVIVNSSGEGVGRASDPVCYPNTGVCVVSALTYESMYEYNDGTTNIDISSWGRMEGTCTLEFTGSTIASNYPTASASNYPTASASNYPTAIALNSPSSSSACLVRGSMTGEEATTACTGKDCCKGVRACEWPSKLEVCLAEGACNGTWACWLSNIITDDASFIVGANSCSGTLACDHLKMPSSIGDGSCQGYYACQSVVAPYKIGDGSCIGYKACYHMMTGSEVGNDCCLFDKACELKGDVGDNQYQNERRLRSSPTNADAQRMTQGDRLKVNRFNVSMGLASPSVSGCRGIHDNIKNMITDLFLFFD